MDGRGIHHKATGDANRKLVEDYLKSHIGATQKECAAATGLSAITVNRHVAAIRQEWQKESA